MEKSVIDIEQIKQRFKELMAEREHVVQKFNEISALQQSTIYTARAQGETQSHHYLNEMAALTRRLNEISTELISLKNSAGLAVLEITAESAGKIN